MKKNPIVTTQHMVNGHDESNRCNDSAVAQQLTAAKAKNANAQKTFKNLFSFIIEKFIPLAATAEILKLTRLLTHKKRGADTFARPHSEALEIACPSERAMFSPTYWFILSPSLPSMYDRYIDRHQGLYIIRAMGRHIALFLTDLKFSRFQNAKTKAQ